MEKITEYLKLSDKKIKGIIWIGVTVVILCIIGVILFSNKEPEFTVISESSLKEILETDELASLEYFYNSVAQVKKENSQQIKYHVSYKGNLRYGINFEDIGIVLDETQKVITIQIPEVKLIDCNVDIESLDFIFEKERYETENVIVEAKNACEEDLKLKAGNNADLEKIAKENAINTINALICPWIEQVADEYEVVIN